MEQKQTIAHSVGTWLPATMTWLYGQLKNADSFRHIVLALAQTNLDQFPWEPIYAPSKADLYLLKVLSRAGRRYPFAHASALRSERPFLLHSHFGDRGFFDLGLARKFKLRHAVTFYGYDVNMLPNLDRRWVGRYKRLFDRADLFLCEGPHMAECLKALGCPKEKVIVHALGVDVDRIPFVQRKVGSDGHVKILIAGSFREKKGIPYALEAIGILRERFPDVSVTIIGDSSGQKREEAEKRKILEVIERYRLQDVTRLLGYRPYSFLLEEAYRNHIFLSPSVTASDGDTEGGAPVTIIEMSASGMPIVSTSHCDIKSVVKDGSSGFLVAERDSRSLAQRLEWLITHQDRWADIGQAGRAHVVREYNARTQGKRLTDIYMGLKAG